jgi:hypothetical protein
MWVVAHGTTRPLLVSLIAKVATVGRRAFPEGNTGRKRHTLCVVVSDVMRPLLLAVILLSGLSCHRDGSQVPVAAGPHKTPQNETECRQCNGRWGIHGLREEPSCLCRTRDAGKTCKDGLECEGECVVVEGKVEVTEAGPPPRGYFVGACTEFDHIFGCHKLLMDGTAAKGPSGLDEALPEMCID